MPRHNPDNSDPAHRNAVTERGEPNDVARDEQASIHSEPKSYAAKDVADASLAAPAAGEVDDYAELAEPGDEMLDAGAQQGGDRSNREANARHDEHGAPTAKTRRDPA